MLSAVNFQVRVQNDNFQVRVQNNMEGVLPAW